VSSKYSSIQSLYYSLIILVYTLIIYFYQLGIRIASLFSEKAKLWVKGRASIFEHIEKTIPKNTHPIWIHCASLGEFEQGRPLIEAIKSTSNIPILLTFFSPSGFEIRKNYKGADYIFYLPADTPSNVQQFLQILQPRLAIFVKYEFWYNYLSALQNKAIPTILIAGLFRKDQLFFKSYGSYFLKILQGFDHIFVQNQVSDQLLKQYNVQNSTIAGDPRADRVLKIAQSAEKLPLVEKFVENYPILVAGSTWQADEDLLIPFINKDLPNNWKVIIAPHEIKENGISQLEKGLNLPSIRYSQINNSNSSFSEKRVLIIDNIGMLSKIYQYGKIAYIGGGFGAGIHNTLEPAAFGLPIIFGEKYQKFEEAVYLVENKGAFSINNQNELNHTFQTLLDNVHYQQTTHIVKDYLQKQKGATRQILKYLENLYWANKYC